MSYVHIALPFLRHNCTYCSKNFYVIPTVFKKKVFRFLCEEKVLGQIQGFLVLPSWRSTRKRRGGGGAARRVFKTFKIWGLFLTEELAHNFFFFYKENAFFVFCSCCRDVVQEDI
jgi:hypothetical protein